MWKRGQLLGAMIAAASPLLWAPPLWAAGERFCAPNVSSWPQGAPVSTDGNVEQDLGYVSAYRYIFANGTMDPHAAVQATRAPDNSALFLSVEVRSDTLFDANDVFALGFNLNTAAAGGPYRRFDVFPMTGSGADNVTHAARSVRYFTAPAGATNVQPGWNDQSASIPAGTEIGVSSDNLAGNLVWRIEMKLPIAALGLNTAADNGFYFNIIPVNAINNIAMELRFPPGSTAITADLTNGLPNPDEWGVLRLNGGDCPGAYMDSWTNDISSSINTTVDTNGIQLSRKSGDSNYFHARVHNTGPVAKAVTAEFWISNFGTSYAGVNTAGGHWAPILGITGGNKAGPSDIANGGFHDYRVGPWILNPDQINQYGVGNTGSDKFHQCVMVVLDSTQGAIFRRRSAFSNMEFNVASVSKSPVEINTNGLGPPAGGAGSHKLAYLVKPVLQYAIADGTSDQVPEGQLTSQLGLFFHPFRYLSQTIVINGHTYNLYDPGPSFGYTIQHLMPATFAAEWGQRHPEVVKALNPDRRVGFKEGGPRTALYQAINKQLAADKEIPARADWNWQMSEFKPVEKTEGKWYTIDVPPDSVKRLQMTVSGYPPEPGKCQTCFCGCTKTDGVAASPAMVVLPLGLTGLIVHWRRRRR
jgi:hypothetical protein